MKTGYYELYDLTNVVRLNYTNINTKEYSLLVLLEGSISSGVMIDLRYNSDDDTLKNIRIYEVQSSESWFVDDLYDSITLDN